METKINRMEKNIDMKFHAILEALHVEKQRVEFESSREAPLKRLKEKLKTAYANEQVLRNKIQLRGIEISMMPWLFGICHSDARKGIEGSRCVVSSKMLKRTEPDLSYVPFYAELFTQLPVLQWVRTRLFLSFYSTIFSCFFLFSVPTGSTSGRLDGHKRHAALVHNSCGTGPNRLLQTDQQL